MKISSRDATIFSGGDDAIIMGRLPTGHVAVRGARLTTLPARSLAARASFSLRIPGRREGLGTSPHPSDQLPDPGSWTIHIPDRSAGAPPCWGSPAPPTR